MFYLSGAGAQGCPRKFATGGRSLGEIANIICGNVVPSLAGGGREYKIESPRSLNKDELLKETKQEKPLSEITLNFNQGRADIKFFVDGYSDTKEKKG